MNYLYSYSASKKVTKFDYEGPETQLACPSDYMKGIYGGANEVRLMQWNIQSTARESFSQKK